MPASALAQRGISLIEALVAMAVMSIGMLAYVSMQSGMRVNGDVAKQRAEAVRIAQEHIEAWRAFSVIDADPAATDYAEIASTAVQEIAGETTNTTYRLSRNVTDAAVDVADPQVRTLTVDVAWEDRTDQTQSVRLATTIARVPPELAGALSMPANGTPLLPVQGRHPAIPPEAEHISGTTTSRFAPPQPLGGTLSWVFDDHSGVIVSICSTPDACVPASAMLLSGQVRFALTDVQPTGADAEAPPSPAQAVQVVVDRSYPAAQTIDCHEQLRVGDLRYFCAVPVDAAEDPPPPRWAGHSRLAGLSVAADLLVADPALFRICRYTPYRDHRAVGDGTPPMRNADHPLNYGGDQPADAVRGVAGPLSNQNFLVIRAGNGSTAFDCPDDDPGTPLIDGTTWRHQPNA